MDWANVRARSPDSVARPTDSMPQPASSQFELRLPPPSRSETVLLVDDEHAVRTVTSVMLQRAGYPVIEAASGEDAVKLFDEHAAKIRLLVSDVVMPGMPG